MQTDRRGRGSRRNEAPPRAHLVHRKPLLGDVRQLQRGDDSHRQPPSSRHREASVSASTGPHATHRHHPRVPRCKSASGRAASRNRNGPRLPCVAVPLCSHARFRRLWDDTIRRLAFDVRRTQDGKTLAVSIDPPIGTEGYAPERLRYSLGTNHSVIDMLRRRLVSHDCLMAYIGNSAPTDAV